MGGSQWDWYSVGGRWGGMWTLKEGIAPETYPGLGTHMSILGGPTDRMKETARNVDCARVQDIAPESHRSTFAYVDLEGEWIEKGEMGWWGMTANEKAEVDWDKQYFEWLKSLPRDTWLINCDCHI